MNKLIILGNLTREPELRKTQDGISVCNFVVAVNRRKGREEVTDFVRVTAWRERGETCHKYLHTGSKVLVMGPVSPNAWTDQQGAVRASLEITADEVQFCGSARKAQQEQEQEPEQPVDAQSGYAQADDDELPF